MGRASKFSFSLPGSKGSMARDSEEAREISRSRSTTPSMSNLSTSKAERLLGTSGLPIRPSHSHASFARVSVRSKSSGMALSVSETELHHDIRASGTELHPIFWDYQGMTTLLLRRPRRVSTLGIYDKSIHLRRFDHTTMRPSRPCWCRNRLQLQLLGTWHCERAWTQSYSQTTVEISTGRCQQIRKPVERLQERAQHDKRDRPVWTSQNSFLGRGHQEQPFSTTRSSIHPLDYL